MVVTRIIYSVNFHQKFHVIPIGTFITKKFFFYKFLLPRDTMPPNGNDWNEFYEGNKMIEIGQTWPSR